MANRFANREDFIIPPESINEHEWIADGFIDSETGDDCTLIYPPTDTECPNCYLDSKTGRSSNTYKAGGPYPFTNFTLCPHCGGEGRLSKSETDIIRLRLYSDPKYFQDIGIQVAYQPGMCQAIGYMVDLPKVERAAEIIVINPLKNIHQWRYNLASEPVWWGIRMDRYFIVYLKRVG
jgi:hypothetical protein